MALSFFLVGINHVGQAKLPELEDVLEKIAISGESVVLSGILRTAPAYNGSKGNFIFDADILRTANENETRINSRILIKTAFRPANDVIPGMRLLLRAKLNIPSLPGTPGSFNYRQFLADQQIFITGYVRSQSHLICFPATDLPDNLLASIVYTGQGLRHKINNSIEKADLPLTSRALFKAIITGQRDEIPVSVFENFKLSGGIHLLAISGMHMAMLALLCGFLINMLLKRSVTLLLRSQYWKISAIFTLIVMACYTTVSGLHPPVVRSYIMISTIIVAVILDRPNSMVNAISLAALLILSWDPFLLFSASFQMSFVAVTSIVIFIDHRIGPHDDEGSEPSKSTKFGRMLIESLSVSTIALLTTAPISLYHFKQVAILSPFTTIIAAPLICFWALPLGLLGSLAAPWFPVTAEILFHTGSFGLEAATKITSWFSAIPFSAWKLPPPTILIISLYYLSAFLILTRIANRLHQIGLLIVSFTFLIFSVQGYFADYQRDSIIVTFIDTGQGSSALIELPGNKNILVDGGGNYSPRFDPGEQIITPFLWQKKIRHLDTVIITHVHHDHYNGLKAVIKNFKPKKIWLNGSPETSSSYREIMEVANLVGAKLSIPKKGSIILGSGQSSLTCISDLHLRKDQNLEENNRSLVLKLEFAGKKIILPGDIMTADGEKLLEEGVKLESDVLLAPHHGSRYSAGYDLVKYGSPDWLVVSASSLYSEKYPDPEFAKWCAVRNIKMLNIAETGSVSFSIDKDGKISWQPISAKAENYAGLSAEKELR